MPRVLVLLLAILLGACGNRAQLRPANEVGLFTSLPILWRESSDIGDLLDAGQAAHWAMEPLSARGQVRPLDRLADASGALPLPLGATLLIAQPRPFAPDENLALDNWVREGGRVLLFADPMLTRESGYGIGDPRRPQDLVLLSPILTRWGLEPRFDDDQPLGERTAVVLGNSVPVNLPGSFSILPRRGGCVLLAYGLAAQCRIGKGWVLVIADAALFDEGSDQDILARKAALAGLLQSLTALR